MQKLSEEIDDYSDILDTDFFDWKDDHVSKTVQFSDVENDFGSKNLIRSLQSTNNRLRSQNSLTPIPPEENVRHGNITTLTCKEIKVTKRAICDPVSKVDTWNREKYAKKTKKNPDDDDSDDLCSSNKKRKRRKTLTENDLAKYEKYHYVAPNKEKQNERASKSPSDTVISTRSSATQISTVSSQEISSSQKMSVSSQEISSSQKMSVSSQEISSQEMIVSSQETSPSQKLTLSQASPKRISSSQESLGNQVMNISIKEESNNLNNGCQSYCGTRTVITSRQQYTSCQQSLTLEEMNTSKINFCKEETVDSKYSVVYNEHSLGDNAVSSKETRKRSILDSLEEDEFSENLGSSVSDSFSNNPYKRYNKTGKRITWSNRKRELLVTKRENAVEIREKLLDAREAEVLKREEILRAKERIYLRQKANKKKLTTIRKKNESKREVKKIVIRR